MVEPVNAETVGSADQIPVEKVHPEMTPAADMSHKIKLRFGWIAAVIAAIILWAVIIQAGLVLAG